MDLEGASAIVTGGASGIGAASAQALAGRGARCVLVDLNEPDGKELAGEIAGLFVRADVTDPEEVQAAVDAAGELGPLRALVNSAGIALPQRTIDREYNPLPLDRFEAVIRVNLLGAFNVLRLTAAAMARTAPLNEDGARGAIVNVASIAAFDGQVGQAAYAASKGGIVSLTLPVARDLAAVGIRVNTVAPGPIETPMWGEDERADAYRTRARPSVLFPRRFGRPAELASMVVELITNDYMNGAVVRVDGGTRVPPSW